MSIRDGSANFGQIMGASLKRKFRNEPVYHDGERFDSKRELKYFLDFQMLQKAGKISRLHRQPLFVCEVNGQKVCTYKADFEFWEDGRRRVIDVKSPATAKTKDFRIKRKLVQALFNIEVEIVL